MKYKKYPFPTLFALTTILFITLCNRPKVALGPSDVIYVLSTEEEKRILRSAIDTAFYYGLRTPEFQPYYTVRWVPITDFMNFKNYRNILVIANVNSKGIGYQIARGILPDSQFHLAEIDSISLFARGDYWVKDQMFILIAGSDFNRVQENILSNKEWLCRKFDEKFIEHQMNYIFSRGEKRGLARELWNKYKWTLRIQPDYIVVREYPHKGFVWIGRSYPYRWISISWADGIKNEWLTTDGLFEKRELIGDLYGGIATDKRFLGFYYTKFGKWDALRMSGLWYHREEAKGGPFVTYSFYDFNSDRTFVIDILMFAPGEKVNIMFRQLEIMAQTFTTSLSKE